MSDLDTLFDNAPEGAVEVVMADLYQELRWSKKDRVWSGKKGKWLPRHANWKTIATRPQPERKTVEDAVDELGDNLIPASATHIGVAKISQTGWLDRGDFKFVAQNCDKIIFDIVCTIEEFKACVAAKAKSEPEWTHGIPPSEIYCRVNHGGEFVNCYLIGRDDMGAFVYRMDGQYYSTMSESNFKPIKPTITKAEAWDRTQVAGLTPQEVNERFTVN